MDKYINATELAKYFVQQHRTKLASFVGEFPKADVVSREQWEKLYNENIRLRERLDELEKSRS